MVSLASTIVESIREVTISQIEIGDRIHFFDEPRVLSLADDIEARGLETPIQLRRMPDGSQWLVAGRHRLEAVKLLGWETIPASVKEMTDDEATCAEIEENQQRGSLTVLEKSIGLAKLKAIYIKRHPETARGGDRKSDQKDNDDLLICNSAEAIGSGKALRFTLKHSGEQGLNEKMIKRHIQIGETLTDPNLLREIGGSKLADNQTQLLKLANQPPADRLAIVVDMKRTGKTTVRAALRANANEPVTPETAKEIWLRKIEALWDVKNKRWQDEFLEKIGAVRA